MIALVLSFALFVISQAMTGLPTFLYLYEHKQLIDDWTTQPYVDIVVVESVQGCPDGYEALFYRNWNGTHELCVEHEQDHDSNF